MVLNLGVCFIVAVALSIIVEWIRSKVTRGLTKVSFDKVIDDGNLPVITLRNGETELNFLVDSGSNVSHFDVNAIPLLQEHSKTNITSVGLVGAQSQDDKTYEWINVPLHSKRQSYSEDFCVLDLKVPFDAIREEDGITLHGILGVPFLKKYRYVLDFDELIMYTK